MSQTTSTTLASDWADALLVLLTRQQDMVQELRSLADQQSTFISAGKTDALLSILGRRQQVIDRFLASQDEIVTFTDSLDRKLQSVTPQQRDRIKSLLDEISAQLTTVMQTDEHDQSALQAGRDGVGRELASLGSAHHARNAYVRPPVPTSSRFADQHG